MKKLIAAVALSVIALNTNAFSLSDKAPTDDHQLLIGSNSAGLARGCRLEEGEFVFCSLDKVIFNRKYISDQDATCAPYGIAGGDHQPCHGSAAFVFQYLKNTKIGKGYDDVECMLEYGKPNNLECLRQVGDKWKAFYIRGANKKNWVFTAIRMGVNESVEDYWITLED